MHFLTVLIALVSPAAAQPSCWLAIEDLRRAFPELVSQQETFSWRGNAVTFECDGHAITRASVSKSATGSMVDVRSAAASVGARITRDTTTAVRSALDRCMSQATREAGAAQTTSARAAIDCRIDADSVTLSVATRQAESIDQNQPKS